MKYSNRLFKGIFPINYIMPLILIFYLLIIIIIKNLSIETITYIMKFISVYIFFILILRMPELIILINKKTNLLEKIYLITNLIGLINSLIILFLLVIKTNIVYPTIVFQMIIFIMYYLSMKYVWKTNDKEDINIKYKLNEGIVYFSKWFYIIKIPYIIISGFSIILLLLYIVRFVFFNINNNLVFLLIFLLSFLFLIPFYFAGNFYKYKYIINNEKLLIISENKLINEISLNKICKITIHTNREYKKILKYSYNSIFENNAIEYSKYYIVISYYKNDSNVYKIGISPNNIRLFYNNILTQTPMVK